MRAAAAFALRSADKSDGSRISANVGPQVIEVEVTPVS
jgi:hypothetical protein